MAGDVAELFNRDPHKLTQGDLSRMVEHYRQEREKYLSSSEKKSVRRKKPAAPLADIPVEL